MAIGRGSEFRETIGYSIIGGASLSTLLTFFVIPCSYTIFDDLYEKIFRKKGVDVEEQAVVEGADA
jgi:HAE1 family hydrophobic/amphiphilic exporter-1